MKRRRLMVTLTTLCWLAVLFLLHVLCEQFAGTYRIALAPFGAELPWVLTHIGMPLLGHGQFSTAEESWLFFLVRGVLLAPPLLLLVAVWRVREPDRVDRWCLYGFPLYLAVFALLVLLFAGTLLLPLQCC